ncbi:MAG: AsmA family protein [Pseudomonadota bacterium]
MGRIGKIVLIGLGAVVGLVVVAVGALVLFFPKDAAVAEATKRIDEATGRHLTINGKVGVTIFPAIGFSAERAALTNPQGFGDRPFFSADKIVFAVALLPLLHGDIQIKRLTLDGAELNLIAKRDGTANWTFPTDQTAPQQQNTIEDLHLDDMRLTHSRISFQGADGQPPSTLENVDAQLTLHSLNQPAQMHAELDFRGQRIKLDTELGLPRAMLEQKQTPVHVTLDSPALAGALAGAFDAKTGALTGQLHASGASLRQLMAWVGTPMAAGGGFGAFELNANMAHQDLTTSLHQAVFKIDAIEARGDLNLITDAQGRMTATGALSAPLFDLNPYLPPPTQTASAGAPASGGVNASMAWSNDPIDLSGLKAMDANLDLQVGALKFQRMTFQNVAMNLKIAHGAADARLSRISLYGGAGTARMIADGSSTTPRIAIEFNADNVQALPLLTDAIGFDRIQGRGHVTASLAGQGASQANLMRTLGGTASFTFNDGAWRGVNLAQIARTIQAALTGQQAGQGGATDFAELGAHFTFANGVGATQDLRLLNPFVRLDGTGVVDVGQQTLDMRLAPRAVNSAQGQGGNAALQGLGIPFRVHGPWAHVGFAPDLGNALQNQLRDRAQGILRNQPQGSPLANLGASVFGSPATTTTTTTTTAQPQQPEQPRSTEQQARDALTNLLGHHK